ncbi:Hsp70 protein-domain-containing protein [Fusarium flagelliforme]|uniref:Heat shock 70 kd protein cognate 1 n=1 Tax=Fusarium flagelliforme TaxID=2675880 RepID=A0A395N371_9HYPO|nr:Hsp70 protein-domain-containing protein [Fusarium flagelliforme]KAH7185590.1 Hsp70 protein-domain-containing protein [Fusarium flagelliforme]RFN54586.1 heat shock 70 kd protein cognate 1 [Fusarium flagelliforme]
MSDNAGAKGPEPSDRVAIGITFGNSNSSIAYTVDDKAEVIANEDGDRQIPTVLSYVDGDEYYGGQAKAFLVRNPDNTIANFRDYLGQEFKSIDPTHSHASAHPQDVSGSVAFTVKDKAEDDASTVSVSEVTTRYLRRLVGSASDYLGKKVTSAVVTVPTNFSEKQREALIKSANEAGLEILQLISDPVAAVLAYDARPEAKIEDKTVVVADLGGTRSDVAVIASRGGLYTILATSHDYEFAGVHLDNALMEHFAKEFQKKHNVDPRNNARSLAKLRLESEAAKRALSLGSNAQFSVESLADGFDFSVTINRIRYEMVARKVFEGFNRLIEGVIKKAGLDVLDIDEVILSGGTAHTPRIANNLRGIFPESTEIQAPATSVSAINPSELLARGAALQASLIQEYEASDIEQSTHPAVTTVKHISNAIGVITVGADGEDVFTPIVAPETAAPARRTVHIPAPKEGGDVLIKIAEGNTHIKVTKPESKPKEESGDKDEDDSDSDDSDEEEETREKIWKIGNTLAEAAVKDVKAGGKVEVTINVLADLGVTVTTREVGGKGGVRGNI